MVNDMAETICTRSVSVPRHSSSTPSREIGSSREEGENFTETKLRQERECRLWQGVTDRQNTFSGCGYSQSALHLQLPTLTTQEELKANC